jgi:polyhydroxyalkanoate synthesis regulator phasin
MSDDGRHGDEKGEKASGDLLGDLESIRSLLDVEEEQSRSGDRSHRREDRAYGGEDGPRGEQDEDVPLLEDVVHGGVSVNESFLAGEGDFAGTADSGSGLNDEIFNALLSDEWRESARGLLDEARAAIEAHQSEWTAQHTDELNDALRARIDQTVQQWLRDVVQARIDELRQQLASAVSEQIRITVDQQFDQRPKYEDPDGA